MSQPSSDRRRFEVQRCLGAGGFGEVYLASMVSAGGVRSEVALKVLHQGLDPRSQAVQRLKDEAKLLGLLNHPSILRIHDLVLLEERVTLVTEFVDGADLDQCVTGDDPITMPAVLNVLGKVADALNAAYSQVGPDGEALNLLHRDIKPSNIRVGKHGEVKLLDFGIAKATGFDREAKTQTNAVIGSFPYMAPERFDHSGDTTASDVYSLGCVLFEAIAGQRLHEEMEVRELFALAMLPEKHDAQLEERFFLVQNAHPEVIELLKEMLSFEPDGRPPLDSLGVRCEDLADEVEGKNLSRWCRRHPWPTGHADEGTLSGRTITETSLSTNVLTGRDNTTVEMPEIPREAAATASLTALSEPDPEVVPEDAAQTPAQKDRERAPLVPPPPPAEASGGRTFLIVGALAVLLLIGVIGAAVVGGGTLAAISLGGSDEDPVAVVERDGANIVPAGDDDDDSQVATTDAKPSEPKQPGDDGVAEVDPIEAGNEDAQVPTDCGDPLALEPSALLGRLTAGQRACLSKAVRDVSESQTDRAKLGRVLLVDATARCDSGGGCASYESEQRYFFEEIDRSDADMLYKWTLHLYATETGNDSQREEILAWVDKALERKQSWRGVDYVKRVDQMLEVGAKVAYSRFEASAKSEKRRVVARNRSVEWLNNRVQLGKDSTEALELCASAAGSEEECRKRMHDEKAQATVTFVSIPVGATISVDGKSAGDAPLVLKLDYGEHNVEMKSGDETGAQSITVGSDAATRWTWRSKEDRWESSF